VLAWNDFDAATRGVDMGNKADDLKGRAKEAAGDLTDNDEMKREGKVDRMTSKSKKKAEDAVDKVRDKVKDVLDR
jgi:uncharacterized protein YjbJ (UPF0337 family)